MTSNEPVIDNSKIASLDPLRWASFHGVSYLFDPGPTNLATDDATGFQRIDCHIDEGEDLALFGALNEAIERIGRAKLKTQYSVYTLPPASYHVTVLDGINVANVDELDERKCKRFSEWFKEFPSSFHGPCELPRSFVYARAHDFPVRLRFSKLSIFGNAALVARLEPADEESEESLERIRKSRRWYEEVWNENYQKPNKKTKYAPHVSLAYFATSELAESAKAVLAVWSKQAEQVTDDRTVTYESISLYAFTDMATFFRLGPSGSVQ